MPENAEFPLIGFDLLKSFNHVVDAEILVVLGENLDKCPLSLCEQREVLNNVQQPTVIADAS